jgi:hypothetical protein
MADSEAREETVPKQSEEEDHAVAAPITKRQKKEPELDENGDPIKKPRKPFEWTEKRKQQFEECKRKRAAKVAERKQAAKLSKEAEQEVRRKIKAWRELMLAPEHPNLISSLSDAVNSAQNISSSSPTSSPDLTVLSTMPNLAPPAMTPAASAAPSSQPAQPSLQPQQSSLQAPPPQSQATASVPAATQASSAQTVEMEEDMATSAAQMFPPPPAPPQEPAAAQMQDPRIQRQLERRFEVDEVPINGKRKAPHLRLGTGAGNHEPYEGEEGYDEAPQTANATRGRFEQYQRGTLSVDQLSDEELAVFMLQARQEAENRSFFNVRRMGGKMQRPSHATMFLDHAYTNERSSHPSTLVSRGLPQQPPSYGLHSNAQQYMWL